MKWLCALLPVAWLQGVACARAWRVLADKGATATIPSVHVGGDDDEYYLEDTGEKEYYYYDQDEYYEYFQGCYKRERRSSWPMCYDYNLGIELLTHILYHHDSTIRIAENTKHYVSLERRLAVSGSADRKPIASLRNRRIEKAIRKLRRLAEAAPVQGCNETELISARNLCERKLTLAKRIRSARPSKKKMRPIHRRRVCRLVTQYADCISAIAPNGECPDIAFKLKTDAQRSVHIEGFQACRSSGTEPIVWLFLTAACVLFQWLWPN